MSDLDQRIRALSSYYLGWGYSFPQAKSAIMSPGIPPSVFDPSRRLTNCSLMSASIVIAAFPKAQWTFESWKQLLVWEGYPRDSPISAVVGVGVGERTAVCPSGQWCLVQGWKQASGGYGHCFLAYQGPDGDLMVVQAATGIGATYGPTRKSIAENWPGGYFIARLGE